MKGLMIGAIMVIACLSNSVPQARAADTSGKFIVLGVGSESCGKFVQERRQGRDNVYRGWVTGYLTAINLSTPNTYNILGSTDLDGILLWLENHCGQQPLDSVASATEALVMELMPNRRQRKP